MSTAATPRRRATDQGLRRLVRENFYRDVWLLLITVAMVLALKAFQDERWDNVRRACEDSNTRYVNTVRLYDESLKRAPADQRKRAQAQRAQTVAFLAALAPPHFDRAGRSTCTQLADAAVDRWW